MCPLACVSVCMLMTADKAHASEISLAVWPLGGEKHGCSDIEEALMLQSLLFDSIQLSHYPASLPPSQSELIPQTTITEGNLEVGPVPVPMFIIEMPLSF